MINGLEGKSRSIAGGKNPAKVPKNPCLKQFKNDSIKIFFRRVPDAESNPGIKPLALHLNRRNIKTISSCEGHYFEPERPNHAYVVMLLPEPLDFSDLGIELPHSWVAVRIDPNLYAMRTIRQATDEDSLNLIKKDITE